MMTTTRRKMTVNTLSTLRRFVPARQMNILNSMLRGEEREFFAEAMTELDFRWNDLPIIGTAGSDQPSDVAMATIHLFSPGADWWIVEKPAIPTEPAFGIADLGFRELGYFELSEILKLRNVEVDLHWTPKTVSQVLGE